VRFQPNPPQEPELNLTPLIDVVFLLLIFFMVSTTFERESAIAIQLPQASSERSEEEQQKIEITIDATGRYYLAGEEIINTQPETLRRALAEVVRGIERPWLVVAADQQTPHQAVVTVMDVARQIGLHQLAFATSRTQADKP
jgi:biopolymer transport protein ExbD